MDTLSDKKAAGVRVRNGAEGFSRRQANAAAHIARNPQTAPAPRAAAGLPRRPPPSIGRRVSLTPIGLGE